MNTPSVLPIWIHIIGFKFLTQSSQFWPLIIRDFKLHSHPSLPSSTYKTLFDTKFSSSLSHSVELSTKIHHKKWVHSTMFNATEIKSSFQITFLTKFEGEPTYQGIHETHPNFFKWRVCPKWPRRRSKRLTWTILVSIHLCYSIWIVIQLPTTPSIIDSDPIWIHRRNYKWTCVTAQGAQENIWYNQSLWKRPEAENSDRLPQWLCGRILQRKHCFCTYHNTQTNITGETVRSQGEMYKAVAQAVLLYGSESCVMTGDMLKVLTVFHHRAERWITGMTAKRGAGGEWVYPVVEETMESVGIHRIGVYIKRRQTTIADRVDFWPVYALYTEAERIPGTSRIVCWWDQDRVNDPKE